MIRALVEQTFDASKKYLVLAGLSTDSKPTTGIVTGSKFIEVDTGINYAFDEVSSTWSAATITMQDIKDEIDSWLQNNIDPDSGYALDRTLSLENAAAPADMVGDLKSALNVDEYFINNGEYTITKDILESGKWLFSEKKEDTTRARTKFLIPVRSGMTITYSNTTFDTFFGVLETPSSNSYVQNMQWKTDGEGIISINKDGYLTFIIRNHANNSATVYPADYNSTVIIRTEINDRIDDNAKQLNDDLAANGAATQIADGWTDGYRVNTSGESIASPSSSSGWRYLKVSCSPGDKFTLNADNDEWTAYAAYAFTTSDGTIIDKSNATQVNNVVVAPATAAYLYVNDIKSGGVCYKGLLLGTPIATSHISAIAIPAGADLDNYIVEGNYKIASDTIAGNIENTPIDSSGRLIVLKEISDNSILQIYLSTNMYDPLMFYRKYTSGTWRSWHNPEDTVHGTPFFLNYTDAETIPDNSDFDDYTSAGNYKVISTSSAVTMEHAPVDSGGRLIVMQEYSSSSIVQIYISVEKNEPLIYYRKYAQNQWTEWRNSDEVHGTPFYLNYTDAPSISSGEDLDNYNTAGTYKITSGDIAEQVGHTPIDSGGRLIVMDAYSSGGRYQIFIPLLLTTYPFMYVRKYLGGSWRAWRSMAYNEDVEELKGDVEYNNIVLSGLANTQKTLKESMQYNIKFANSPASINLENYVGNIQNVHPKVLYFENGFGGHKYWMAYTPYPYSNDDYENPCIAYSEDGYHWTNYDNNPLSDPEGVGYNSDTHLVYRSDTSTLECWYRYVGPATQSPREETIKRRTTTDGVTWTSEETVYSNTSGNFSKILSPSVIFDGTNYNIWAISSTGIDYYTAPSDDVGDWTYHRSFDPTYNDDGLIVDDWHLDVIKDGSTYIYLVMCRNGTSITNNRASLFVMTSSDNITLTSPIKIVGGSTGWDKYMYRSSIVKIGSVYRIYYSAGSGGTTTIYNNAVWGIGITESESVTTGYIGNLVM
jgi:hypothetical protein